VSFSVKDRRVMDELVILEMGFFYSVDKSNFVISKSVGFHFPFLSTTSKTSHPSHPNFVKARYPVSPLRRKFI
jgi:hypothetical protein